MLFRFSIPYIVHSFLWKLPIFWKLIELDLSVFTWSLFADNLIFWQFLILIKTVCSNAFYSSQHCHKSTAHLNVNKLYTKILKCAVLMYKLTVKLTRRDAIKSLILTHFRGSHYSTLKEDLEVIPKLKISPYIHSKQAVLHTHTLFTGSHYSTLKEDLEVIPILKISLYIHSKQAVLHTHTLFTDSHYSTLKEDLEVIPKLKISPYIHSKQAVLHTHTLFTGSHYSTLKEDLEVMPVLKISPHSHSKQAVLILVIMRLLYNAPLLLCL